MKTTTKLLLAILFATLAVGQAMATDQNKKEQRKAQKEQAFLLDTVGRETITMDDGTVVYAAFFRNKDKHPSVEFQTWVQSKIKYPNGCTAKGKVEMRIVVEKDGSAHFLELLFSPDPALTEAVKEVVEESLRWHPAVSLDGKEFYRTAYTINVLFSY